MVRDQELNTRLDESLAPRGPSVLLQVVRELDLPPDSRVVDVGCGTGEHAFRLATHFGFRVLGIDPVQRHLDLAREARRDEVADIAARVAFERGSASRIPVPDASLDLAWCRDLLGHVDDPADAMFELARVLRPGAYVVSSTTVATDLLAPEEADELFGVLGVVPTSTDPHVLDDAIAQSGLEVVETIDLGSEWAEWSQEQDGGPARALLHLSRLLRAPARYRAEFGDPAYDGAVAECRWQVFQMAGKLAGRIDVLRRPTRR